jgi:hypothetical protein
LGLGFVNIGGPGAVILVGFDNMLLAPRTTYTFQAMAGGSGAAGDTVWTGIAENAMTGTFWPA